MESVEWKWTVCRQNGPTHWPEMLQALNKWINSKLAINSLDARSQWIWLLANHYISRMKSQYCDFAHSLWLQPNQISHFAFTFSSMLDYCGFFCVCCCCLILMRAVHFHWKPSWQLFSIRLTHIRSMCVWTSRTHLSQWLLSHNGEEEKTARTWCERACVVLRSSKQHMEIVGFQHWLWTVRQSNKSTDR